MEVAAVVLLILIFVPFVWIIGNHCYYYNNNNNNNYSVMEEDQQQEKKPGGLANPSNNCFANSVVQALAGLDSFIRFVSNYHDDEDEANNNIQEVDDDSPPAKGVCGIWNKLVPKIPPPCGNNITATLGAIITRINESCPTSCSALIQSVFGESKAKSSCWRGLFQEQQDAQEFYQMLMDAVDIESSKEENIQELKIQGLDSVNKSLNNTIKQVKELRGKHKNPFLGTIANSITCQECGSSQGYVENYFTCLSIPIGNMGIGESIKLQECLKIQTAKEQVSCVECQRCSLVTAREHLEKIMHTNKCKSSLQLYHIVTNRYSNISRALSHKIITDEVFKNLKPPQIIRTRKDKITKIATLPKALAIHISRSQFDVSSCQPVKSHARIEFPKFLDMSPYTLDLQSSSSSLSLKDDTTTRYKLQSLIIHYGTHNYGHYITYRQRFDKWFRISDMDVSIVPENQVFNADNVFMLFYERQEVVDDEEKKVQLQQPSSSSSSSLQMATGVVDLAPCHSDDANSNTNRQQQQQQLLLAH